MRQEIRDTLKRIGIFIGVTVALTLTFVFAEVHRADAPAKYATGVIVFEVNDQPKAFVFVDNIGEVAIYSAAECKASKACTETAIDLATHNKATVLNYKVDLGQSI